jgi:hypothetical protein
VQYSEAMAKKTPEPWYQPQAMGEVCPLCGRLIPASERSLHHLVPKTKGGRHTEAMHRICHRQIHALFSEAELADRYPTVEALLSNEAIQTFVRWVRAKPDNFYERTRRIRRTR